LTYAWYRNDVLIATTNTGVYIKHDVTLADAGIYYVIVSGCCGAGAVVTSNKVVITVDETIIAQKWDDVLYVDNSKNEYIAYQWYKIVDGRKTEIVGATAQYYTEKPLNGIYVVEALYNTKGDYKTSCPYTVTYTTKNIITIYPNPVEQSGTLTIHMDMDIEQISGSLIEVYDMVGKQIEARVVEGYTTKITMQMVPGAYAVRITNASGEVLKSEKVIVR
jgi:hypothetical protein